jgi:phosphoglycerate dehydrogenase-like enzyme
VRVLIPPFPGLTLPQEGSDALTVDRWDGTGDPPDMAEIELWVPPFGFGDHATVIASMGRLRVVQLLTVGYDDVTVPAPLTLCNAVGLHDGAVAEWVLAAILASLRELPAWILDQRRGELDRFETATLAGATVLLIGHGGIGREIERRLAGFDAELIRVAAHARPGVHATEELPRLLPQADVVVLAVPLTDATRGLVGVDFLAALPDGALVVNIARGAVVDQPALETELASGRLRAALDVATPDPLPPGAALRDLRNVLYTPHLSAVTRSIFPRLSRLIGEQATRLAAGEALVNVVSGSDRPPRRADQPTPVKLRSSEVP